MAYAAPMIWRTTGAKPGSGMLPTKTELGAFIRARRLELGLGQRSFARVLGGKWTQGHIQCLERGFHRFLRDEEVLRLAWAFDINPDKIRRLVPPRVFLPPGTPLARLIRSRREALGLTRAELAQRARSSVLHIWTIERTARGLRYEFMLRLVKALRMKPSVLAPFAAASARPAGSPLGRVIRNRRKALGLSAAALGRKIGMDKSSVLAVESGKIGLTRNNGSIERYARALGLKPIELGRLRPLFAIPCRAPDVKTLGGHLTRRRLECRWSQIALSERTGLSAQAICRIEQNQTRPRLSSLRKLADAFGCDIEVLRLLRHRR